MTPTTFFLSVSILIPTTVRFYNIPDCLEILHTLFSNQEVAHIGLLAAIAAIQTNQSESGLFMKTFFIWQDVFTRFSMSYSSRL